MKKIFLILSIIMLSCKMTSVSANTESAKAYVLMDMDSGRVLSEKNKDKKMLIASTTKIMTAIITIENIDINKEVEIGKEILTMYGTNIYIELGEKITIRDLLYGLLLRSGNDASVALATAVSGKEEDFVKLMNKKAKEIGMVNTIFHNPHGLDEETENYSTAYDMALLSQYAYQNETYKEISKTTKYTAKTKEKTYLWYNRNKLLSSYEYCTGGKNGYTPRAGRTLVTTASKDNLNLTAITLSDPNEYETHKYLYEKYFSEYRNYVIIDKNKFSVDKNLYEGNIYLKESFVYPLKEVELESVKTKISITNNTIGKEAGTVTIYLANKEIGKLVIYKNEEKKSQKKTLLEIIKSLFTR